MSGSEEPLPTWQGVSWRGVDLEVVAVLFVFGVFGYLVVPLAGAPALFPDSGTVLSISRTLANGNPEVVWSTQSPPLQDALYASILAAGWPVLHYPVVLSSFGLAVLLGFIAYRFTGDRLASAVPPLLLLFSSVFWIQMGYLPLYAAFVLAGYAGLYLSIDYVIRGGSRWTMVGGAVLLAVALYTFTTALAFLVIPCLALVFFYSKARAERLLVGYGFLGVCIAPWIIWHLRVGGLQYFFYHPLNWFTVKYLGILNAEFWNYERESLPAYLKTMSSLAIHDLLPPVLLLFVIPGFWYVWQKFGPRAVFFCIACMGSYALLLSLSRPAPFARYLFPVLPLVVLLASAGVWIALGSLRSALGPSMIAAAVIGACTLPLLGELPPPVASAHFKFVERLDSSPGYADFLAMEAYIAETDGGIIARDSAIQQLVPNNQVFTHFLLSERDYVVYLSWPSDDAVIKMFQRTQIEWAIVYNDLRWERDYNVWLEVAYGMEPKHFERLADSAYFDQVYAGKVYQLYRLDPGAVLDLAAERR